MSRRRDTSLLGGLFELLTMAPWWGGVIAALLFYLVLTVWLGHPAGTDSFKNGFRQLCRGIGYLLAGFSLVCAAIAAGKRAWRRNLVDAQSGIESIRNLSWRDFETMVGESYCRQGYAVEERGGGGADGGIDLVLRRDGIAVLVQCKQWKTWKVGVKTVRELYGVVVSQGAERGILICSGTFTADAVAFASANGVELVDGAALAALIHGIQKPEQRPVQAQSVMAKPADVPLCPICSTPMVRRTARKGQNAGGQFWGCPRYPECKGIRQA